MKLRVKDMDIATGGVKVCILNELDAETLDLHPMDRLLLKKGRAEIVAVLDIANSKKAVPEGRIGLMEETLGALKAKDSDIIEITLAKKPESVNYIRKRLDGHEMHYRETFAIIKDIVNDRLTDIELTTYVVANYIRPMSLQEIVDTTNAMVHTGAVLKFRPKSAVVDVHSIGGVPGNRTTMIIVPILVAAGLIVPKTSSRAITSPAGTADTMEVLCNVSLPESRLKKILETSGGFIVWGGALNLAPADDKIIRVEYPLSIDAEGQMIASIMSKKACVQAEYLLLEIPYGPECKVKSRADAAHLGSKFEHVGRELGIKVNPLYIKSTEPVGNGIGPCLEARDCLWILKNDKRAPQDLRQKSIMMAAELLEFCKCCKKGNGLAFAEGLLASGKAFKTFAAMVKAQSGNLIEPDKIRTGDYRWTYRAERNGTVLDVENHCTSRVARLAGCPRDHRAGLYLHVHEGWQVKKGDALATIYAKNSTKLNYAKEEIEKGEMVRVG